MPPEEPSAPRRLRLRHAGTCRGCGTSLEAGEWAVYHRLTRQVECLACAADAFAPQSDPAPTHTADEPTAEAAPAEDAVGSGTAGASARREYERRVAKREDRVRAAHPRLGGLILALTDDPQSTRAWVRGATGEERIAKRFDRLADEGVLLLHDRRIPRTRTNIDHIAVSSAGVFVIDAKRYQGRPRLQVSGGLFRPRTETLLVGRRDCTKLVEGVQRQAELVRGAVGQSSDVPVSGMLCFIDADWPLIGGSFSIGGIDVVWPGKVAEMISEPGALTAQTVEALHRKLARAFPPA